MLEKEQNQQIPVLMYHSISDKNAPGQDSWTISSSTFASHLEILKNQAYVPLTVTQLVSKIFNKANALPDNPIVLTFDDGLSDFISVAMPILDKYSFTATIYIPTAYVGKATSWSKNPTERNKTILSWPEIQAIADHGIECGSHGHTHSQLDILPPRHMWDEVKVSKDILEQHLQRNIWSIAYPYGLNCKNLRKIVKEAGYSSGCAVKNTMLTPSIDQYTIPRLIINSDINLTRFHEILAGEGLQKPCPHEPIKTRLYRIFRKLRSIQYLHNP